MTSIEDDPLLGQRVMAADLRDAWPVLDAEARVEGFRYLTTAEAEEFFLRAGGARPRAARAQPAGHRTALVAARPGARRRRRRGPGDAARGARQAARAARRRDAQGDRRAAGLLRGRGRRPDEPALRAPAPGHERRRGDQLPAAPDARARREHLLRLRARRAAEARGRRLLPPADDGARRRARARRDGHGSRHGARRDGPGGGRARLRAAQPDVRAGARRRGPHEGHRDRRRHRRRRARGGDRGHPEDRRYRRAGRALPAGRLPRHAQEARRLADGAVRGRDVHRRARWAATRTRSSRSPQLALFVPLDPLGAAGTPARRPRRW